MALLTTVSLARFQFAMTTIFHFFFVPFSIGTALMVAIMETMYVIKKDENYKTMTKFWGNIMLLSFAVGVVTGIIQEFQFGMNWSDYSRFVGDIFGAPLACEALISFFMESTFLGLWMFSWTKVSAKLHALFVWLVVLGSMTSAAWILAANAFMQNPVGYTVRNGRAEMTNFFAILTNKQFILEYAHVIAAAIALGGIVVAGMAAFAMLKRHQLSDLTQAIYKKSIKLGLIVTLVGSVGIMAVGDVQMQDLITAQPVKFAAMEGEYKDSGSPAAWTVLTFANKKTKTNSFSIKIPYMLSILSYHKLSGSVKGINSATKEVKAKYGNHDYTLPVMTMFLAFRIMGAFGGLLFVISLLGLFFIRRKKQTLYKHNWMLWILGLMTFVPFIANTCGWLITELGRYPWTVYGLFTIQQSVSPNVTVTSLIISNVVYFLVFSALAVTMVTLVVKEVKKGPEHESDQLAAKAAAAFDPFAKEALQ